MLRLTMTAIATLAALTFIGASGVLNALFWYSQARSGVEGYILGAVSVAGDLLKAVLPIFIGLAWARRRWLYVGAASVAFAVFLAAGLVSAIGFVASNRGEVVGDRSANASTLDYARSELAAVDRRLEGLSGQRPVATIQAALGEMSLHPRYLSSSGCTNATITSSREFCAEYLKTKAELASATEESRLSSKRSELVAGIVALERGGAGREVDPQSGIFARWLPGDVDVATVRDGLVLFFAILIEFGAAFGLFLATRHGAHDTEATAIAAKPVEPASAERMVSLNAPEHIIEDNQSNKNEPKQSVDAITSVAQVPSNVQVLAPRRFVPRRRWIEGPSMDDNLRAANGERT